MSPSARSPRTIVTPGRRAKRLLTLSAVLLVSAGLSACLGKTAVNGTGTNNPPGSAGQSVGSTSTATSEIPTPAPAGVPPLNGATSKPLTPPPSSAPVSALHTPQPGTPERKAILDALRVPAEKDLGQKVVFQPSHFAVEDGWAFVYARPLQPSGNKIDYSKTQFARPFKDGMFEDAVTGLLRYQNGAWKVAAYDIGATDVVWEPWPKDYGAPAGIFPALGL